ncbi:hypothetical protein HT031_005445 [Scenedesmus sp. PABB004]|nr:hypothetical protein HT031_005445 [Scenedesmus sp. PABB004]
MATPRRRPSGGSTAARRARPLLAAGAALVLLPLLLGGARRRAAPPAPPRGLAALAGAEFVLLGFTSSPYLRWALNWARHVQRLGVPHAVIALDAASAAGLAANGVPVYDVSGVAAALGLDTGRAFRSAFQHFRTMGYIKVTTALALQQELRWRAVVLSDTDVAWLRHPGELLSAHPAADLLVSTDCLSADAAAAGPAGAGVPRCGSAPGAGRAHGTPAAEGYWLDDQLTFTEASEEGSLPWRSGDAPPPDGGDAGDGGSDARGGGGGAPGAAGVWAFRRRARVAALAPLAVANGHVALEQRLPARRGVTPVAVHDTFQTYGGDAGKVSRFMEAGLWLLHPAAHYAPGRGFLTYGSLVTDYIAALGDAWAAATGRRLAALHAHLVGAAFQLQVLAEALAAARALGRLLVPPRFVCFCWQDSGDFTGMLASCALPGADVGPPMECSASHFLSAAQLDSFHDHARLPGFLEQPRMADALRTGGVLRARVVDDDTAAAASALGAAGRAPGAPALLPRAATPADLAAQLGRGAGGAVPPLVVALGGLAPGWLTGAASGADAALVGELVFNWTATSGWCCLTTESGPGAAGQSMAHAYVGYSQPELRAATDGAGAEEPWRPPDALFTRPAWCDGGPDAEGFVLTPRNRQLAAAPQHPCTYLAGVRGDEPELRRGVAAALEAVHLLRLGGAGDERGAGIPDAT